MRKRVVFLFYHGFGHLNPIFKLAQILVDADYEVFFAGHGYFQQYVQSQGFSFYLLKSLPFGYGFEKWTNMTTKSKSVYLSTLRDRITARLYKERRVELFWMLEELKPTVVLFDAMQATDYIILHSHVQDKKIRVAVIQVTLPMDVTAGHPPINSDVFPNRPEEVKRAIKSLRLKRIKNSIWKKLFYFGFDDAYIIRRSLKNNSIPLHYSNNALSLLNFSLKNIPEFILTPKEFDFTEFTPESYQHFIGFMTDGRRIEPVDPTYENVAADIFAQRETKKQRLVYCSFGTTDPIEKDLLITFLKRLIHVARDEAYILIISLQSSPGDVNKLPTGGNVFVFNAVPQLQLLQHTDLFITHGGINSIKEAVYAEVPMLLYPIHRDFDRNGNAARIEYHALGVRGNISADSFDIIKQKIKMVFNDPIYKTNVQSLKLKDQNYTDKNFLDLFKSIHPPREDAPPSPTASDYL